MSKILVVALALAGCCFLVTAYAPQAWKEGFHVQGHTIPFAFLGLAVVGYLGYKLKSK